MVRSQRVARGGRVVFFFQALAALCAVLMCTPSFAQYEVEQDSSVWVRGVVDVRLARGGTEPSWTDGGAGKPRYGGRWTTDGYERTNRIELAQLAVQLGAALPGGLRAQAQINLQPDLSRDDEPWLVEAFLRKEWGRDTNGFGLQAGVMNMPFSLEHTGAAWSPEYSISASALNSWLWEEISLAGLEGEWWHDTDSGLRIGAIVGAGYGPDQLGRLIALRGWVLGDGLSGLNAELPLPNGTHTDIFDERDDRPAAYTWLSLGDTQERATLRLGYFDNFGDQNAPGVWDTRFATLGVSAHPHPMIEVVAQYLRGEARVRDTTNDSDLRAYYGLVSFHRSRHRLTARYDWFRVDDVDGGSNTREKGKALTLAWFLQFGLRHRLGLEHVWLDARRPAGRVPDLSQDGWQLSYRFRY